MNEDSTDNINIMADTTLAGWNETNMSTQTGINAEEIGTYPYTTAGINSALGIGSVVPLTYPNGSNISFTSVDSFDAGSTRYSKTTIATAKNTIDLDELADMMNTLKKRLLILTPDFEKHEKYPMLKELYNEYKAMEALLAGPNSNE